KEGTVLGVKIETENKEFKEIDTVTLYLNPQRQQAFYDYVISLNPKRVIFNPGTENPEFYNLLDNAGIDYEIACTLVLLATNQY
ncbi:MAG TPA: CoA-binding protein, partial [Flavobacteriaceae bacterium]|nr:CoA-binding protein [Flavobacteriaceae bacterium]